MRKRSILGIFIAILAISVASGALLEQYVSVTGEADVKQSVVFSDGDTEKSYSFDVVAGNTYWDCYMVKNRANVEAPVEFTTTYSPDGEGILTVYAGHTQLTEKNVNFSKDVWTVPEDASTVSVKYTMVGDSFDAEVVEGAIEDYTLVYYKDNPDRFDDPGEAIPVDEVSDNLPYTDDANADEYDYCDTGEYTTCHGAKLWYVPTKALSEDGTLDWSMADEFYFETELIQYNSAGEITIYPGQHLGVCIGNMFDVAMENGTYTVTTNVNPVIEE